MFCEQCGKQLKEGAAFCAFCGAKVNRNPAPTGPAGTPGKAVTAPAGTPGKTAAGAAGVPGRAVTAPAGTPGKTAAGVAGAPGRAAVLPAGPKNASGKAGKKGKGGVIAVIAVAVIAVAAGVGGWLFFSSDAYNSRKNLKEAQSHFEAQEYDQAEVCYEEALKVDAGLVEAYLGLADIYLGDGRYEDALKILEKGQRRTREDQEAQKTLTEKLTEVYLSGAEAFLTIPDYTQALVLLEEGIQVTGDASLEREKEKVLGLQAAGNPETDSPEAEASAENPEAGSPEAEASADSVPEAPAETAELPVEETQYILPDSASRYLTMEDLEGLTKEECRIARNELFARHGRLFADEELQAYFNSLDWYQGTILPDDFDDSVFNEYEVANRDLITQYEEQQGYR